MRSVIFLTCVCMAAVLVGGCVAAPVSAGEPASRKYLVNGESHYEAHTPQLVKSYGPGPLIALVSKECATRYPALFTTDPRNAVPVTFWVHNETTVSELVDKIAAEVTRLGPATPQQQGTVVVLREEVRTPADPGSSSPPPATLPPPTGGVSPF